MGEMTKARLGWIGAITAIVLVAALQGCGGSSDSTTKADFVKEAKAICNKGEQKREELATKLITEFEEREEKATQKLQEESVLKLLTVYEGTTEKLAELDQPEGEEEKVEAIIEAREEGAEQAQASPATLLHSAQPLRKAENLSEDYGLGRCAI
jgi:hypothetical protein